MDTQVLIVGAGPTGLALALWLNRLGVRVRIIDKAAGPGTTSRALAVQARTLEFYRQVGVDQAVIDGAVRIDQLNLWVQESRAVSVALEGIGAGLSPYPFVLSYPQDVHETMLVERLNALGVQVERRTELLSFEQDAGGVASVVRGPGGGEEICRSSYLAGCDGASSLVRETLGIGFPGGTYAGLFYVADVEATGRAINGQLHLDFESADFVLVFPLKRKGHIRLVGVLRDLPGAEQDQLSFEDVKGRAIEHLELTISQVNWFSTYRVHHRAAERFRDNRVFLLGDAAHIHSPVGGQGMNTGIGDAVNLAWKLAAVLAGRASDDLLATYEPERIAFARRLVQTTDRAFTLVTKRGRIARLVRTRIAPRVVSLLFRWRWFRRLLFKTVSQLNVNYRHSALSDGEAGGLKGGDRLPWIELGPGQDNFDPLTALTWQVHIYGEPHPEIAEVCASLDLPLHRFDWQAGMEQAGLARNALYLLRPDGYIALAGSPAEPDNLQRYVNRHLARGARTPDAGRQDGVMMESGSHWRAQ